MNSDDHAESIRKRMADLRRELTHDVADVSRSAREMAKPSYYVRKFPWATLVIASAVGYLLVPKKKPPAVSPDPETLAELIRKNQVHVETSASAKQSKGMLESLAVMGLTWAARTGLQYIGNQLTTVKANKAKEPQAESPKPEEQPQQSNR